MDESSPVWQNQAENSIDHVFIRVQEAFLEPNFSLFDR